MTKRDTYVIDPSTKPMGFLGIIKSTLAVVSIPIGLSIAVIIATLILSCFF